jgi:hypothetical protein
MNTNMDNQIKKYLKNLNKSCIPKINLDEFKKYDLKIHNKYLYLDFGIEHYQLLANISTNVNNKIFYDIGTNYGSSALALSVNKKNKVESYDVVKLLPCEISEENINFNIGNCINDLNLLSADLIFLDTMHDGSFEKALLDHLVNNSYKGVVIMDDVNEYPILRLIANDIAKANNYEIIELTSIGHYSGTLAIIF